MINFNSYINYANNQNNPKRIPVKTIQEPKGELLPENNFMESILAYADDTKNDAKNFVDAFVTGKSNDHNLGNMQNLGLLAGGLGIASYLATKKPTTHAKAMEFIGVGTFLATMSMWSRIFIDTPTKLFYGFDPHRQYVDSQGRKKDFFQDNQYLPWDLWSNEEINKVGDRMFVDKNIPERENVIKEKMRVIALQDNTLALLTAGLGVPLTTALVCTAVKEPLQRLMTQINFDRMSIFADHPKWLNAYLDVKAKLSPTFNMKMVGVSIEKKGRRRFIDKLVEVTSPTRKFTKLENVDDYYVFRGKGYMEDAMCEDLKELFKVRFVDDNKIDELAGEIAKRYEKRRFPLPSYEDYWVKRTPIKDLPVFQMEKGELADILRVANSSKYKDALFSDKLKKAFVKSTKYAYVSKDKKLLNEIAEFISDSGKYTSIQDKAALKLVKENYNKVTRKALVCTDYAANCTFHLDNSNSYSKQTETYKKLASTMFKSLNLSKNEQEIISKGGEPAFKCIYEAFSSLAKDDVKWRETMKKIHGMLDSQYVEKFMSAWKGNIEAPLRKAQRISNGYSQTFDTIQTKAVIDEAIQNGVREEDLPKSLIEKPFKNAFSIFQIAPPNLPTGDFSRPLYDAHDVAGVSIRSFISRFTACADFERRLADNDQLLDHKLTNIAKYHHVEKDGLINMARRIIYFGNLYDAANRFHIKTNKQMYMDMMDLVFHLGSSKSLLETLTPEQISDYAKFDLKKEEVANSYKNYEALSYPTKPTKLTPNVQNAVFSNPMDDFIMGRIRANVPSNRWLKLFGGAFAVLSAVTVGVQLKFGNTDSKKKEVLNAKLNA